MTAPSEPVRPADEETVQALAQVIAHGEFPDMEWPLFYDGEREGFRNAARAVVASEPWQRLVRERDEARAAVARVEALAENFNALEHDHGIGDGHDACGACWVEDITRALTGNFGAALRGDAEEASDGR